MSRRVRDKKIKIYRRTIKFTLVLLIMLIVMCTLCMAKSYAATTPENECGSTKVFISAEIRADHDIYTIASENMPENCSDVESYINEVRHINHINDLAGLDCGNCIIVPSYR